MMIYTITDLSQDLSILSQILSQNTNEEIQQLENDQHQNEQEQIPNIVSILHKDWDNYI